MYIEATSFIQKLACQVMKILIIAYLNLHESSHWLIIIYFWSTFLKLLYQCLGLSTLNQV